MIWLYVMLIRQSQVTEMALFHQIADLERFQISAPSHRSPHGANHRICSAIKPRDFSRQAERALDTFADLSHSFDEQSRRMSTPWPLQCEQAGGQRQRNPANPGRSNPERIWTAYRTCKPKSMAPLIWCGACDLEMEINVAEPMADMEKSIGKSTERAYKLVDDLRQHSRRRRKSL